MTQLYQHIVNTLVAIENCKCSGNQEWELKHKYTLELLEARLPSGSGFDSGSKVIEYRNGNLILSTEFHHMNECGYYDGWTTHKIIVKPDLQFEIVLTVTGPNRNDIKDHIQEVFQTALTLECELPRQAYERKQANTQVGTPNACYNKLAIND